MEKMERMEKMELGMEKRNGENGDGNELIS